MNWIITNLIQDLKKKWSRITASNHTVFFILISVAQALILIYLQFRILQRNGSSLLKMYKSSKLSGTEIVEKCYDEQFLSLYVLTMEDLMFIFFYFFQLYFCFNAIFHRNTIQIITIASINLAFIFIGIMQLFEIGTTSNDFRKSCPGLEFYPQFEKFEIFFIVALAILAMIMGYLSHKLYRQFGWDIYKAFGSDVKMQKLYKTRLIFIMLLKLDALMIILFAGLLVPVFYILFEGDNKPLMIVSTIIMMISFLFEILAYKSLNNEWATGMLIFIVFWVVALFNFAGLCVVVFNLSLETSWYIGFIMGIICFGFSLSTLIYALFVYKNFGKGLKNLKKRTDTDDHPDDDKSNLISKSRAVKRDSSDPKFEKDKFVIDF
ncbi:uncharacterized protein OCT59_025500 [Rhizophagus irregularis]|uniref:Uncharacterized protein n=1 Tax=Rhizophagus irregularis TaxID=588596 RepID=A0A916EFT3_9GLOM|nr:hypothetical protein OCT59_025500 [Rhizophagus irregularis]GBC11395.1 hypothetical protein GLOIN_2v1875532 [Rhizophagus irregularis DAOM 181602=DAOM 197198]CAB5096512.1 unnamed protein product [Rhizophagus irregularis]CAB5379214.1 unnamed protein product [Rhizophagus irregularis]